MKTAFIPSIAGPMLCFVVFSIEAYVNGTHRLSAGQAFSSLAIIGLMTAPAQDILSNLPSIAMSTGCLTRIQGYLLSDSVSNITSNPCSASVSSNVELDKGIELQEVRGKTAEGRAIVTVENASIKPSSAASTVVHDVSLQILKGSLTMLIGVVGSGKTTLLKGIIRELDCDGGTIHNSARDMAYCSQTAWLQNASIRNIVCGPAEGDDHDTDWYKSVIHACAFDDDLAQLPDLDDTIIGSRGITLSGGQKQRLVSCN